MLSKTALEAFYRQAGEALTIRRAAAAASVDRYDWLKNARPEQRPPGEPGAKDPRKDWRYWMLMTGRGFGKTRTGSETVREQVRQGRRRRIAMIAPTLDDGRKLMIEGISGLLAITPPDERPRWIAHKRELHWPNGAIGYLYTTEEPERLRGPEHDFVWCEEMGAWRNPETTWSNMRFGLRLRGPRGDRPQVVITTTPRPTPLIRKLVANPRTIVQSGTTYENQQNLAEDFLDAVLGEYEGTRLGQQELEGKLLTDTPGALWKFSQIEALRVVRLPEKVLRTVIAVDPAVADAEERRAAAAEDRTTAETGIIVVARGRCLCKSQEDQHAFVYRDLSGFHAPHEWARIVADAYHLEKADRVIAEVNNGGALVESNLRTLGDPTISYKAVHASKGKATRAEPISALYEQGKVHHVGAALGKLEDQLTTWNPLMSARSPDRLDALVWALTELMLGAQAPAYVRPPIHIARRI